MFEFEHKIRYSDYKDFETVKVSTALELIQEAAIQDSDQFGYSIDKLRSMNLAWLLLGYNVHFNKKMSVQSPITTFTAVKTMKAATSVRGAVLYQDGEIVAKVYKVSLYITDANDDYTGREKYLKDDLEEQVEKLWVQTNHLKIVESEEFEWDDDLTINSTDAVAEDYEAYFNKGN